MRVMLAAFALAAIGCSDKERQDGSLSQVCQPRVPASGSPRKLPHPTKPSSCTIVAMSCNYCAYDENGKFTHSGSELCGACVAVSMP
jgi:hypothetical protein